MKKNSTIIITYIILIAVALLIIFGNLGSTSQNSSTSNKANGKYKNSEFRILASQENKDIVEVIEKFGQDNNYNISVDYAGTLEIIDKLNAGESTNYDAVLMSNSIWVYMLDNSSTISNSVYTCINPVIFGIKKSKAQELGLIGKEVYTRDIVKLVQDGKLKFSMANPTQTNSGASAYLGLISTLAGNPEVLSEEMLNNDELKSSIKTFFTGLERSSGDEDYLESMATNENYEAFVTYESSIIDINKKLVAQGKEPLYAIYPVDGVSISDTPFGYINNKDDNKKLIFDDIKNYIKGDEGKAELEKLGRRTWYGGINANVDTSVFNKDWGIDTTKYITPTKYPSKAVIKASLNLYQLELRKPVHVAFCLDYSGSMYGSGIKSLRSAMEYILTESKASKNYIQFSDADKIDVIPFSSNVIDVWSSYNNGKTFDESTQSLLTKINSQNPGGSTALYPACIKALELLQNEDLEKYSTSVVLMTDGVGNVGSFNNLDKTYHSLNKEIPIYSITFGDADDSQLQDIADLTNAKVFDGKSDLVKAFKQVRGYN